MKRSSIVLILMLLIMLFMTACNGSSTETTHVFEDLPVGDAVRGAELYVQSVNRAPTCISCHVLEGTNRATPSLIGYGAVAGERVEGMSAEEYSFWAIVDVGRHITPGYANVMYNNYGDRLESQDIADLIAYILDL